MKFDHIGIFVDSLEYGREHLSSLFPIESESQEYHDALLKVSVQFLYDVSGICYEIVAPNGAENPVSTVVQSKKNILNHVAYKVNSMEEIRTRLEAAGIKFSWGPGKTPDGRTTMAFIDDPDGYKIELLEYS